MLSAGDCEDGLRCTHRVDCPQFLREQARLDELPSSSPEKEELTSQLESLVCNKEERGVCCRSNLEIAGGTVVSRADQFPFIARIQIKKSSSTWSFCGGSLIRSNLILTAKWRCSIFQLVSESLLFISSVRAENSATILHIDYLLKFCYMQ